MDIDTASKLVGLLAIIGPPVVARVPRVRKWLFGEMENGRRVQPQPLAQATLAMLGGLFGAGVLLILFIYFLPSVKRADVSIGPQVNASKDADPKHGGRVYNAQVSCNKGKTIIAVSCVVTAGTSGTLINLIVGSNSGVCTWNNASDVFAASASPICLEVRGE